MDDPEAATSQVRFDDWPVVREASVMRQRFCGAILLAFMAFGILMSCGDDGTERYSDARTLAKEFHNLAVNGRYSELAWLVNYPFSFDRQHNIESEPAFQRLMQKKGSSIGRRARPATAIEVISYERFLAGDKIAGVSLGPEEAEQQAKKVNLGPGCLLIRCFHEDAETGERDGRGYWLVVQANSLGDLKVITYYD